MIKYRSFYRKTKQKAHVTFQCKQTTCEFNQSQMSILMMSSIYLTGCQRQGYVNQSEASIGTRRYYTCVTTVDRLRHVGLNVSAALGSSPVKFATPPEGVLEFTMNPCASSLA